MIGLLSACGGAPPSETSDAGVVVGDDAQAPLDPDGGDVPGSPPALESPRARQVGVTGEDLRVDATVSDPDADATAFEIRFLDGRGEYLAVFDSDDDGDLDDAASVIPFESPLLGTASGAARIVIVGLSRENTGVTSLEIAAVDMAGHRSAAAMVALESQPVVDRDGLCDPDFVDNRCADGLACRRAVPAVCVDGTAPVVERAAYYRDTTGVRILVEGADPDDDVTDLEVEFLDAEGNPVSLDLDGDGSREASSSVSDVRGASSGGVFFARLEPSEAFAAEVAQVALTVVDRGDRESERRVVSVSAPPARALRQACDAHGFDVCSDSVCLPNATDTGMVCTDRGTARGLACEVSAVMDAFAGGSVQGVAEGTSLWDAPSGCATLDPVGRPEGIAVVHLARDASRLVVSSDNAYTNFDTVLYFFGGCDGTPLLAWCNDDQAPNASERRHLGRLELRNVPAGDYVVVVDSFSPSGGRYQIDVSAE